jgi:hypothetical protein
MRSNRDDLRQMDRIAECKLCKREAPLQFSHIYPEFFYKPMYDSKHRFIVASSNPEKVDRYEQKGIREFLLCSKCEQQLSNYERYAREIIYGRPQLYSAKKGRKLHLKGIDYSKFKLFLLSLIWRMGISKGKFFQEVELGPYEEELRLKILTESPGKEEEFGCFIAGVMLEGEIGHWFLPPSKATLDGITCYRAVIGGLLFMFFITKKRFPPDSTQYLLKENGTMVLRVDELTSIDFLRNDCFEIAAASIVRREVLRKS